MYKNDFKSIDAHTHFKEKFLKVLTREEIYKYLKSGVEYMIGVTDFFPVNWGKAIPEAAVLLHCYLREVRNADISANVIQNLLWEEADYSRGEINAERLSSKLAAKISDRRRFNASSHKKDIHLLLDAVLPHDTAQRFVKNSMEEVCALKVIRKRYGLKAYLCVGIHPLAIKSIGGIHKIKEVLGYLRRLLQKSRYVMGIGECGLEENTPLEKQVLREILLLAKGLRVPVVMHTPLTHGKIPSKCKLKGIADACAIVKKTGINIGQVAFDHITDQKCVEIIDKAFPHRRPYLSLSIQKHWVGPMEAADLIARLLPEWGKNIMVNSDFGTFQTPQAFSLVKRGMAAKGILEDNARDVLHGNAFRFFKLADRKPEFNISRTRGRKLVLRLRNMSLPVHILLALKGINDWLIPAYRFKDIICVTPVNLQMAKAYLGLIRQRNIKVASSGPQKKRPLCVDVTPAMDFACLYDKIERGLG